MAIVNIISLYSKLLGLSMIDIGNQDSADGSTDRLTMDEILSTTILIIFSRMGHNLTFLAHLLATNLEVQNRLVEDIKIFFANNPNATLYKAADSIKYTEMVFKSCSEYTLPLT